MDVYKVGLYLGATRPNVFSGFYFTLDNGSGETHPDNYPVAIGEGDPTLYVFNFSSGYHMNAGEWYRMRPFLYNDPFPGNFSDNWLLLGSNASTTVYVGDTGTTSAYCTSECGAMKQPAFYMTTSPSDTLEDSRTRFTYLFPAGGVALGSTTPASIDINAQGWVNDWNENTVVKIDILRLGGFFSPFFGNAVPPIAKTITIPIPPDPFERTTFLFIVSTTTVLNDIGDYRINWSITQPAFTLFGINVFTNTLTASSTLFTVVQPTQEDIKRRDIEDTTGLWGSSNATSTPNDCNVLAISDCVSLLFTPSANSLAFVEFSTLGEQIKQKPPIGWFGAVTALLSSATTSTSTINIPGMAAIANAVSFLKTGLAVILWVALAIWIFMRFSRWDFQA